MNLTRLALGVTVVLGAAYAQTVDLGQDLFFNNENEIVVCVDAALAVRKLDSPFVMFMLFMGSKSQRSISVHRDNVIMVYKGQEYKMPSLEEWRKEYAGGNHDFDLYRRLGKDALALSQMRLWRYPWDYDFFPVLGSGALPSDQLSMSGLIGARTKIYFRNPGFQKGDELLIKVRDQKNPDIIGLCGVVLNPD
jgi:hypothetical protein